MQTVTAADGTRIAYERSGEGPPLLLLHGGSVTRRSWDPIRSQLAGFTLLVPDRRGRGDSGDSDSYGLGREVADVRAVADSVDGDPLVFAHSFGALVALAAAETTDVERVVLYEPPIANSGADVAERMQASLAEGRRREAIRLFYREEAGIPDPEALPIWPDAVRFDLAETVARELAAARSYDLPDSSLDAPMTLLTGSRSPDHLRESVRTLAAHDETSEVVELDGVGHVGTQSAPERVASAVRSALTADGRDAAVPNDGH